MFTFFNAAQRQRKSGAAVKVPRVRYRVTTMAVVICATLLCWGGLIMVGHYSRLLYSFWLPTYESTVEMAQQLPYKLSTQRYFYKTHPLPPVSEPADTTDELSDEGDVDPEVADEQVQEGSSAHLRERVERALKELTP